MSPRTYCDGRVVLHHGDCLDTLRQLPDNSVDSVCTDPPYHLTSIVKRFGGENASPAKHGTDGAFKRASAGFMGKQWDGGDIAFQPALWAEVLRVLKPGGYITAFGGSRTWHRMACAIEDAGFVTHPMIGWVFGTGFPKATNVSKQIDKAAGATREVVGINEDRCRRKPNGSAGKNSVGYSRVTDFNIYGNSSEAAKQWDGWFYGTQSMKPALEPIYLGQKPFSEKTGAANVLKWGTGALNIGACRVEISGAVTARWPANLITDGSEEVQACFPETPASTSSANRNGRDVGDVFSLKRGKDVVRGHDDNGGSAARFFYSAKASKQDRAGSRHPTVKPISLIRYLVRLITPPGGVCLDLFAGSGTTGEACLHEGFCSILIEREDEYVTDIDRRMSLISAAKAKDVDIGPLFEARA